MAPSATDRRPLVATVAGLVVGALAAAALAAAGIPRSDQHVITVAAPAETEAAARRFVAAWERSRRGTWVVEASFARVTSTGRRLETSIHMAQRPPDRLVTGLGTIDSRRGGERLACAADAQEMVRCRSGGPARPYDAEVEDDLDILRGYVDAERGFYGVLQEGACFRLRLRRSVLSPPYGQRARFCFDPATGAPVRSEVDKREARDRTVAVSIRARPTDADLDPEKWGGGGRG